MIQKLTGIILLSYLFLLSGITHAEEVTLPYKGITLNATLELSQKKPITDGVILIVHGTLGHKGMEITSALQNLLKDNGLNTLAINLSYNINNRSGMYDCQRTHTHKHTDALSEIGVWIDWLKKRGVKEIFLIGHSRGGNHAAWFASQNNDPAIKSVILVAPMTWDEKAVSKSYKERYKKDLQPLLEKAQKLIKSGKGDAVLTHTDFLYCEDTSVTAEAFVSYYAPDKKMDTPFLIPQIKRPVFLAIAKNDTIIPDLIEKASALSNNKTVHIKVFEMADHFFRDLNAEELADEIVGFLKR
ncbi:MAG: alpha/beta fold hydrolase [Nitrospirae bacterium]|nr:alpha/beta fold hydrolase [Nitrospirota bacterium]